MSQQGDATILGMLEHRSIRRFTNDPVSTETLERWVQAGQAASTSSHVQAFSAIRITEPKTRERLVELTGGQRQVAEAGAFLVICGDSRRHRLLATNAGTPCHENFESFLVAAIDAALFAQNLVVAAESEGAGICYIGGLRNDLPAVDALLELPAGVFPLFGLCLGTPAEDPAVKPRLPIAGVLFTDRYPGDGELERAIEEHDAAMAKHYAERGLPGRNWSGGVGRKRAVPHRTELPEYYTSKGARLDGRGGVVELDG